MSQYNHCIVTQWDGRFGWVALYCNTMIVLQEVWLGAELGAGGARGAQERSAGAGRRRWERAREAKGVHKSAARGSQVEASGDAGCASAGQAGAQACCTAGARGIATRQLVLRHDRGARPRHGQTQPHARGHVRPGRACVRRLGVLLGQQAVHLVH